MLVGLSWRYLWCPALFCSFTGDAEKAGELEGGWMCLRQDEAKALEDNSGCPQILGQGGCGKSSWCSSMAELPRDCSMGSLAEGAGSSGGVRLQGAEKDLEGLKFLGDLP